MLQTFCRYRQMSAIGMWQVLVRSGGSCGPAEPLETVTAREGKPVQVPVETRPGRFVTVRIHGLEPSLLDRVRTAMWKADEWYVTIADVRYRMIAPTAADGLLLAVPSGTDGTGPFAFGPPIGSLSVASQHIDRARMLTYEFESVPLSRSRRDGRQGSGTKSGSSSRSGMDGAGCSSRKAATIRRTSPARSSHGKCPASVDDLDARAPDQRGGVGRGGQRHRVAGAVDQQRRQVQAGQAARQGPRREVGASPN